MGAFSTTYSGCDPRFHKATGNHDLCTSGATGMEKKIGRIQQSTTLDAEKFSRNFVPVGPVMEMVRHEGSIACRVAITTYSGTRQIMPRNKMWKAKV